jgi:hypothetical protein
MNVGRNDASLSGQTCRVATSRSSFFFAIKLQAEAGDIYVESTIALWAPSVEARDPSMAWRSEALPSYPTSSR